MNSNTRGATGRRRHTAEQRRELVEGFRQREESAAEFARRHGLATSTLHRWVRTEGRPRGSRRRRPAFQEIRLPVEGVSGWAGEVCLPDGTRVRWNGVTGLAGTERLVEQLRRPC
jgi:transposase-like protein